jgi:hypothetical protein
MFASVTLPVGIGDNLYQLLLRNGTEFEFATTLTGGVEHSFWELVLIAFAFSVSN